MPSFLYLCHVCPYSLSSIFDQISAKSFFHYDVISFVNLLYDSGAFVMFQKGQERRSRILLMGSRGIYVVRCGSQIIRGNLVPSLYIRVTVQLLLEVMLADHVLCLVFGSFPRPLKSLENRNHERCSYT